MNCLGNVAVFRLPNGEAYCFECAYGRPETPDTVTPPASPPAHIQVNRYQRGRMMVCSSTYGQPTDEDQEPDLYRPRPTKNSSSHARTLGTSINPIDLTESEDERVASCACGNDCTIFYSCTSCNEFECEMIFTFTDRCMYCRVNKR